MPSTGTIRTTLASLVYVVHVASNAFTHSTRAAANDTISCSTAAFTAPTLPGVDVIDVVAESSFDRLVSAAPSGNSGLLQNFTISYCGVNVTYTHPGWDDTINVQVWLPLSDWNGRFQGVGGGGWVTGNAATGLPPAVVDGYAAATTDGGHSIDNASPLSWGLKSPGNVNYHLLQDFAAVALSDMTIIGKQITEQYYRTAPRYSYWNGCSTGGRQGLMLAQRYPSLYDGIMARAPAVYWGSFIIGEYWAQQVMNQLGVYPELCELGAFTEQAISACDKLDGLEDGVIVDDSICDFDPHSVVGSTFLCNGTTERKFTTAGATVVEAAWTGPIDLQGKRQGNGFSHDSLLATLLNTTLYANGTRKPTFSISYDWISIFVEKDPDFKLQDMSYEKYFEVLHQSRNQYTSIIDTTDPDLTFFKASGGKMITWHGTADDKIPLNNSIDYYQEVLKEVPNTEDFYRLFELPGVSHCGGGPGFQAVRDLDALVRWVEEGVAPESLQTANATKAAGNYTGAPATREACLWPMKQVYDGVSDSGEGSFTCK